MVVLRTLSVLAALAAIQRSVAIPRCHANEFQAEPLVFSCKGSGGSGPDSNSIKVKVAASVETVVGTVPKGVIDFVLMVRSTVDADVYLRDVSTGESIYKAIPGATSAASSPGAASSVAGTRSGVYKTMSVEVVQSAGMPTVESVRVSGMVLMDLQVVVNNLGATEGIVELGYYYGAEASGKCSKRQGCLPYDQDKIRQTALKFSTYLSATGCEQAWSNVGAPQTKDGAYIPYYNWPAVFKTWTSDPLSAAIPHISEAMYKFATDGGLAAGKTLVYRSDFMWMCNLKSEVDSFIQPCCAKLRTAFTDPADAWSKLTKIAAANGHGRPMHALWEVCRTLPHAPDYREKLFRYFNSDGLREMNASDIGSCYPSGAVQVKPTTAPLFDWHPQVEDKAVVAGPAVGPAPWEDDGVAPTSAPVTNPPPTDPPSTAKPSHGPTAAPTAAATAAPTAAPTVVLTITDPPPNTPVDYLDVLAATTTGPVGAVGISVGSAAPANPALKKAQGIAAGVVAGVVAAAAVGTGGMALHNAIQQNHETLAEQAVRKQNWNNVVRVQNLGKPTVSSGVSQEVPPSWASISAKDLGADGTQLEQEATAHGSSGTVKGTVLILLAVFCGLSVLAAIVGACFYFRCCKKRKRGPNSYNEPDDESFYSDSDDDQEQPLSWDE